MKKLSLKNLNLDAKELLQKDQLKAVFGGYGGGYLNCNDSCEWVGFTCSRGATHWTICRQITCASDPNRTYKTCV